MNSATETKIAALRDRVAAAERKSAALRRQIEESRAECARVRAENAVLSARYDASRDSIPGVFDDPPEVAAYGARGPAVLAAARGAAAEHRALVARYDRSDRALPLAEFIRLSMTRERIARAQAALDAEELADAPELEPYRLLGPAALDAATTALSAFARYRQRFPATELSGRDFIEAEIAKRGRFI